MLQGCRKADRAEVVERAPFATPDSLKSHGERNLLSSFSNTCAITKVVHAFEANTPFEKLPGIQINVPRLNLHKRPRHRRCPTSRDFVPWRFSDAGRRTAWIASSCRHPKTCTGADMGTSPPQGRYTRNAVTMPCGWLSDCGEAMSCLIGRASCRERVCLGV